MDLYEYQARDMFEVHGVPVLRGITAMETLYSRGLAPLPKSDSSTKLVKNFREQFKWPLGLAMILLIVEIFLPQRKRVRRNDDLEAGTNAGLKSNPIGKHQPYPKPGMPQ